MSAEERILILAPLGRDGPLAQRALGEAAIPAELCSSVADLCAKLAEGAGAALLTEEVLRPPHAAELIACLARQPPWSDFPLVVFGIGDFGLGESHNLTLLDRPVRIRTLLSAMRSALRSRRRQYQARDLLEALQKSVSDRDQFLAMLGHELRNPLAAILTASELLDRGREGAPLREREVISRQSRNLARLVDDLLDVARVTAGKIELHRTTLDLGEAVQRAVQGLEQAARRQGVSIQVSCIPQALVQGDALRLEQIIGNLVNNAIKYTPEAGRIAVEVGARGDQISLRVHDTGIGISADMLSRIFDLFAQAPASLDRAQGGMGIGLTLVRRLVELHGGTVRAGSRGLGLGSEFEVLLPRAAEAEKVAAAEAPQALVGQRVLIVEDNADTRELLAEAMEQLGHCVSTCEDGLLAIEAALRQRPDAMLIDLGLPGRDGYEVARAIRSALGAKVRLIALSGYGQPDDQRRARLAGFDTHLTKPAEIEAIDRALRPAV
jgi:signal transduction histidine kinase/CheY-like chemotaxis protein